MSRVWNFSAGPATLPEVVLKQAAQEMLDWHGKGLSVMEMSHRSPEYMSIFESAQANVRQLLNVPTTHEVLFMQGGAVGMNALIPMNLMHGFSRAGFVNTGVWSLKTHKEFARYGQALVLADNSTPHENPEQPWPAGSYIPNLGPAKEQLQQHHQDLAYVHYCDNETIVGLEFNGQMEALMQSVQGHADCNPSCPLVADVSSNILSRPVEVSRYGILYGGAQKNVGSAGVTIAIVHKALLAPPTGQSRALPLCPSAFEFKTVAENGSMYNTPPTYAIYIAGLVFEWLKSQGGVAWAQQQAQRKSQLLYQCISQSHLYHCPVKPQDRSRMNVWFRLRDTALEPIFVAKAKERGLVGLKGHKIVGGIRASIYNAMPLAGVEALVAFMHDFERHGERA